MGVLDKKVSVWHIIYIVLICTIFCLVVILILPGRICEEAYTNFSFAATITSIVLAVVSIVYSLQSGLSSVGQLNSIKDVEVSIKNELQKFSDIEGAIKKVIDPIEKSMGEIKRTTTDIKNQTGELSEKILEKFLLGKQQNRSTSEDKEGENIKNANWPSMFYVIFYMCQQSYEKKKNIPYSVFRTRFQEKIWYYCLGVIKGVAVFGSDILEFKSDGDTEILVTKYNDAVLGSKSFLREEIEKLNGDVLVLFDDYFN